jgi:hypothetical protein
VLFSSSSVEAHLDKGGNWAIVHELQVATDARFSCSVVLQKQRDILGASWAFTVALGTSTVEGTGFRDVMIRPFLAGKLIKALALPLRDIHTGEIIFNEVSCLLDALCENWRDKVLSMSTDSDRGMVGSVRVVATRMENAAEEVFLRVWCGLHHVDLFMQEAFKSLKSESFYKELMDYISYLRRQKNLIMRARERCWFRR